MLLIASQESLGCWLKVGGQGVTEEPRSRRENEKYQDAKVVNTQKAADDINE